MIIYSFTEAEYMAEGSLAEYLSDKSQFLSSLHKIAIAKDVAKGINFLHTFTPTILHCDLKPGNLLV